MRFPAFWGALATFFFDQYLSRGIQFSRNGGKIIVDAIARGSAVPGGGFSQ